LAGWITLRELGLVAVVFAKNHEPCGSIPVCIEIPSGTRGRGETPPEFVTFECNPGTAIFFKRISGQRNLFARNLEDFSFGISMAEPSDDALLRVIA
jgi:hypothetical protein